MVVLKKSIHIQCRITEHCSAERLFDSIRRGEEAVTIQALLYNGANINARDSKGNTPLLLACVHRRKEIVDMLITYGADVDCCNVVKLTALHYVSSYGWTETVRSLVKKVLDLNARDIRGETAIHHASRSGHLEAVKCLVEARADIEQKNCMDFTPLLVAAQYQRKDVVDQLLYSGANVDADNRLLLYYASICRWWTLAKFLGSRVPNLDTLDNRLAYISSSRHLKLVRGLVGEGTDINARTEKTSQAALHHAAYLGDLEVVKWVVKKVADIDGRDINGVTALHFASTNGHLEVVKCLIEEGAAINARDGKTAATALHKASEKGRLEIVKCLVEKGADMDAKNFHGVTPSLCAAEHNRKEVIDLLLYSGAKFDGSNPIKSTMLHYASAYGWIEIVKYLVKGGCDLDARNVLGITALSLSCGYHHLDTAQYLLQAGASWDTTDKKGQSPLNFLARPEFQFFKLFIENGAYLKPTDYDTMVKSSSLRVLKDTKLCCQAILNKFNHDLAKLYKLPASESLPRIEKMKIWSGSERAQAIERTVGFEIETKGHCNIIKVRPMVLSVFCVGPVLEYYKKKGTRIA